MEVSLKIFEIYFSRVDAIFAVALLIYTNFHSSLSFLSALKI